MKNVLIISPHGDDEVLSTWTYLLLSKNRVINLTVIYQAVNEKERIDIIDKVSNDMVFNYYIAFPGWDSKMDKVNMNDIVSYYDKKITNDYDIIIIPSKSFHQDHIIAHEACIAALRRNTCSSILITEHPFIISQVIDNYTPNKYMRFHSIEPKIRYLKLYDPYLKKEDIDITVKLNTFRGQQINKKYAETFQIIRDISYE